MKKFLPILAFIMLLVPAIALAQAGQTATEIICNVLNIAKNLVAAVGFGIVIILIIVAGIRYMMAAGDETKAADARKGIQNALIGLVIVLAALFLIVLAQSLIVEVGFNNLLLLRDPCGSIPQPLIPQP